VTNQVQAKQYLRPENGKDLAYSFAKLIDLRERNLSKILPVGIEKIDRKSNATRPIEIFPVYFLPEESTNKRETATGNEATKLSDRIDEICKRIMQNQLDEKLKVHGIEPYFSTRTKNKTPDLLDLSSLSTSSLVTTPREYFTPRSVHSSASISKASVTSVTPNSPRDVALSSPLEVISEDDNTQSSDTQSADNADSKKFKMRPPKMSSFSTDAPKAAEFQPMYGAEGQGNMVYGGLIPYALPYPVSDYAWPYPVAYPLVYPYIPNYFSPTVSSSQSPASSRRSSRLSSY